MNIKEPIQEQRILLVDDDKDFAEALYDLLEPEGYLVSHIRRCLIFASAATVVSISCRC